MSMLTELSSNLANSRRPGGLGGEFFFSPFFSFYFPYFRSLRPGR